jgi:outer membrane protein assembly factor BamD
MRFVPFRVALLASVLAVFLFGGCAGSRPDFAVPPASTDDPLAPAKGSLASGNELQAIERLNRFLQENPGSIHVDEANFLLGLAYLEQKDRVLAADYFQKVTRDFEGSRWARDAAYWLAYSYDQLSRPSQLDQDWTDRAIGAYRVFIAKHPDHEKVDTARTRIVQLEDRLAKKSYENGALYLRMRHWRAAEIYFQQVLEDYPQSNWVCRAALGLGESFYRRSDWTSAAEQLTRVVDTCSDPEVREKAAELLDRSKTELARATPADTSGAPDSASAP